MKPTGLSRKIYQLNRRVSKLITSRSKSCVKSYENPKKSQNESKPEDENENSDTVKCEHEAVELYTACPKDPLTVTIVGGGYTSIGTMILLKQNPAIDEIRFVDTTNSLYGSLCDSKQIDTSTNLRYFPKINLLDGLKGADIVAVMDEDATALKSSYGQPLCQFAISSHYVRQVAECAVNACPSAIMAIFAQPVTATLPLVSEIFKCCGFWDPKKIVGSAATEAMKISAITASYLNLNPACFSISITGGVDPLTITPLFCCSTPHYNFSTEEKKMLREQLISTSSESTPCASHTDMRSPLQSDSVGTAKFLSTIINGLKGHNLSITSAYVRTDILQSCKYLTSTVKFGTRGVEQNLGIPKMSKNEVHFLEQVVPIINQMVDSAYKFVNTGRIH